MLFFNDDDISIMNESRETLLKLESAKKKDLLTEYRENFNKYDRGRSFYEEYDPISNEMKMKIDLLYYDQFFQKLDESTQPDIQTALISLYKTINQIYEHVNIKPAIYGNDISYETINLPLSEAQNKLSKTIYEYLDLNFYRLDGEARKKKYYDKCLDDAKTLISEGSTPEDSISFAIKTVVMENLLVHISFPFAEWSRINYLCENEEYGEIFDQEGLNDLMLSFNKKIHNIAKIVALCV